MSVLKLHCKSSEELETLLVTLQEQNELNPQQPQYLLFTGEVVSDTGKSWCPDCTVALPIIYDLLEATHTQGYAIIECEVNRADYKQPTCVYRQDVRFKIKCVPQLCKW